MRKVAFLAVVAAAAWTGVVFGLLRHAVESGARQSHAIALAQARALFQQVVDVRSWNASHGGVYVEVSEAVQPNPYLDVPERDIETTEGRKLTLVNPSYMTRQIAERGLSTHGAAIHITSLRPIRPENAPLPWEEAALQGFEVGAKEYAAFHEGPSGSVFRYMAPLTAEPSCLRCHARQGYRAGEIRGGISVTIPQLALAEATILQRRSNYVSAAAIWVGGLLAILFTARFFAGKEQLLRELEEISLEDPLTGLKNRRGFMTLCAQQMQVARRWKKPAILLFIDVDLLKEINDSYGHGEGDEVLRTVARIIGDSFRHADVTARVGGDEFAVFCLESESRHAPALIGQLQRTVERENARSARPYEISLSVGAAQYDPEGDETLKELMRRADADMYGKKRSRGASALAAASGTAESR